jgi:hypothetical protein
MLEFPEMRDAYRWLEGRIGFQPLFLAAGFQEWQIQMTGYQDQWRRLIGYDSEAEGKIYRGKRFTMASNSYRKPVHKLHLLRK